MKFQQVQYFLAVCEERSFTRAARRCGVAQPTVTKAIKELEARIGGALFVRQKLQQGEISPTLLGLAVLPHFLRATRNLERAARAAARLNRHANQAAQPANSAPHLF
jgi:DNA-binding transcriptional LysR family regulator